MKSKVKILPFVFLLAAGCASMAPASRSDTWLPASHNLLSGVDRDPWVVEQIRQVDARTPRAQASKATKPKPAKVKRAVKRSRPKPKPAVLEPGKVPTGVPQRTKRAARKRQALKPAAPTTPRPAAVATPPKLASNDVTAPTPDEEPAEEASSSADDADAARKLLLSIGQPDDLVHRSRQLMGKRIEPREFAERVVGSPAMAALAFQGGGSNPVKALYLKLRRLKKTFEVGTPKRGDLVFFHNTRDLNGDNRNNDWYATVGVVTGVEPDGVITFIAPATRKVAELRVNLAHPRTRRDEHRQRTLNSFIRPKRLNDPATTRYLAGELFACFAEM